MACIFLDEHRVNDAAASSAGNDLDDAALDRERNRLAPEHPQTELVCARVFGHAQLDLPGRPRPSVRRLAIM